MAGVEMEKATQTYPNAGESNRVKIKQIKIILRGESSDYC